MKLPEIKEKIKDMKKRYGLSYSTYSEQDVDGEVKFVDFHIRFEVESGSIVNGSAAVPDQAQ